MGEFDALYNLDVEVMAPKQIKLLRESAHLSQAVFAAVLNTSLSTVQKWEIGVRARSGLRGELLPLTKRGQRAVCEYTRTLCTVSTRVRPETK